MMNERQLFKFAFLMSCARDGLGPEETAARIGELEKIATEKRAILGLLKSLAGFAGNAGLVAGGLALGTSAAGGAGLGYLAAKLREGNFDADAAKKQELIAAYNSVSDEVEGQHKLRNRP